MRTYLDIDGRVGVLHLGLLVLSRSWFLVGHIMFVRVDEEGRMVLRVVREERDLTRAPPQTTGV